MEYFIAYIKHPYGLIKNQKYLAIIVIDKGLENWKKLALWVFLN